MSLAFSLFTCSISSGLVSFEAAMFRDETYHDCPAFHDEAVLLNTDVGTIGNLGVVSWC